MKKALITGINGQDGAYLAKFLLSKEYEVHGIIRSHKTSSLHRLNYLGILDKITLHECNICHYEQIRHTVNLIEPNEIYNLAAQSSVGASFKVPKDSLDFNLNSVSVFIETIRTLNPTIKFYQASSSEMFGQVDKLPITEDLTFNPVSPYAVSKASAHWLAKVYRESYNMFCCSGILFNHESYLRGQEFVTKKILSTAIRIKHGSSEKLKLGNTSIKRDWGYAPKYVEAMWLMMQQDKPEDYIIASGQAHSLQEFIESIFTHLDLNWKDHVETDPSLFRPADIDITYGCPEKARKDLGWDYSWSLDDLTKALVEEELANYIE